MNRDMVDVSKEVSKEVKNGPTGQYFRGSTASILLSPLCIPYVGAGLGWACLGICALLGLLLLPFLVLMMFVMSLFRDAAPAHRDDRCR